MRSSEVGVVNFGSPFHELPVSQSKFVLARFEQMGCHELELNIAIGLVKYQFDFVVTTRIGNGTVTCAAVCKQDESIVGTHVIDSRHAA